MNNLDKYKKYDFTLNSYRPLRVVVTRPQISMDSAAKKTNQLIANHGGNAENDNFWFMKEFGVGTSEELFQNVLANQTREIEAYTEAEIKKSVTGQLALRLEQQIPEELIEDQLKQIDIPTNHEGEELGAAAQQSANEIGRQRAWQEAMRIAALLAYANHEGISTENDEEDLLDKIYNDVKSKSKIRIL